MVNRFEDWQAGVTPRVVLMQGVTRVGKKVLIKDALLKVEYREVV